MFNCSVDRSEVLGHKSLHILVNFVFICKQLKTQEMKEEFYHPSLNYPHGPVATPKKKSRRTKKGVIEIKVLFDS